MPISKTKMPLANSMEATNRKRRRCAGRRADFVTGEDMPRRQVGSEYHARRSAGVPGSLPQSYNSSISAFARAHGRTQLVYNFARGFDCRRVLVHVEGDGAHTRVSSPTIAFTDLRQINHRLLRSPRIRPHRYLHAKAALAEPYAINGLRMQIVRNEFVVALEFLVRDVEKNRAIGAFGALS